MSSKIKQLGFLAISSTATPHMAVFPITPGFDRAVAEADLKTHLAKEDSWWGYTVAVNEKGSLQVKQLRRKA